MACYTIKHPNLKIVRVNQFSLVIYSIQSSEDDEDEKDEDYQVATDSEISTSENEEIEEPVFQEPDVKKSKHQSHAKNHKESNLLTSHDKGPFEFEDLGSSDMYGGSKKVFKYELNYIL